MEYSPQKEHSPSFQYVRLVHPVGRVLAQRLHAQACETSSRSVASARQLPQSTSAHLRSMIGQNASFSGTSCSGEATGRGLGCPSFPA